MSFEMLQKTEPALDGPDRCLHDWNRRMPVHFNRVIGFFKTALYPGNLLELRDGPTFGHSLGLMHRDCLQDQDYGPARFTVANDEPRRYRNTLA